jgi:hypothetical protein
MITQQRLMELLAYDEHTGDFHWRVNFKVIKAGDLAGSPTWNKYWRIAVDGREYPAHRLAWLYVYGSVPAHLEIDHKDRCKTNNRIANLRLATRSQNQNNIPSRRDSLVPLKGVTKHPDGKFQAQIKVNGRSRYLGLFTSAEAAHAAYSAVAAASHGEFACGVSQ